MRMVLSIGLAFLLAACGHFAAVRTERLVKVPVEAPAKPEPVNSTITVTELLTVRQALCRLPTAERADRLERDRQVLIEKKSDEGNNVIKPPNESDAAHEHLLYALMLATCEPHLAPGLVTEFLSEVNAVRDWPEEHQALFDLLAAEQRSYLALDEKYRELLDQHEKTIQGIKKIETEIDKVDEPTT